MSQARPVPERIDLLGADDPRDVVHRAVAALAGGGVVALPGEAAYVLAASALVPQAIERVRAIKAGASPRPFCLGLRGAGELADWVPDVSASGKKLARRAWPGPVTLIVRGDVGRGLASCLPASVRAAVAPGDEIGLRMPSHDAVREVRDLASGPLVLTDAPARDGRRATSADDLPDGLGVDMIVDDGPCTGRMRNTVLKLDGDLWDVVRPGAVPEADLRRMTGTLILFVCTGNTCRSPMAEALCRLALAERLNCPPEEVESRGFVVASAGLAASRGARAAGEAMEVVEARGGSLRGHASQQLTPEMVDAADVIVAMTRDHLGAILDEVPDAESRARLLHSLGGDIPDPIGCDRETYRRTADAIQGHLRVLLDEILPPG